jgi:hypothetical protein
MSFLKAWRGCQRVWLARVNVIPRPPIKLEYTSKGPEPGGTLNNGATVKLFVNGTVAGEGTVGMAMLRHEIEPFEIGRDSISLVSPDYKSKGSFPFTGRLTRASIFRLITSMLGWTAS